MKKLLIVLAVVMSLMMAVGCSKDFVLKDDPNVVADKILNETEFPDMVKLYKDSKDNPENVNGIIDTFYGLKVEDLKNYAIYYAGSGGSADEIAIIEFADSKTAKDKKSVFEKRIKDQKNLYSGYAPLEAKKLEKAKVEVKGNYVFLIISSDPDAATKIFNNSSK